MLTKWAGRTGWATLAPPAGAPCSPSQGNVSQAFWQLKPAYKPSPLLNRTNQVDKEPHNAAPQPHKHPPPAETLTSQGEASRMFSSCVAAEPPRSLPADLWGFVNLKCWFIIINQRPNKLLRIKCLWVFVFGWILSRLCSPGASRPSRPCRWMIWASTSDQHQRCINNQTGLHCWSSSKHFDNSSFICEWWEINGFIKIYTSYKEWAISPPLTLTNSLTIFLPSDFWSENQTVWNLSR